MDHKHRARRTPTWLVHAVAAAEDAAMLEQARPLVARLARPLTRRAALHDVLAGLPIGHALHPLLTDFPLGAWLSASILDLTGAGRRAQRPPSWSVSGWPPQCRRCSAGRSSGPPATGGRSAWA